MMRNVCDRCKKILPEDKPVGTLEITFKSLEPEGKDIKIADLCKPCFESFCVWLHEESNKKEPPKAPEPKPGKNLNQYWKKGEVDKLIIGYKHNKTTPELAKELNRDEEAVKQKIIFLKNEKLL
jgi:hypothetical protein